MLFIKESFKLNLKETLNLFFCVSLFIFSIKTNFMSYAASDNAQSLQTVNFQLLITKISDLDFGTSVQGESLKFIPAGLIENPENASFLVIGEPGSSFNINLPTASVFLNHATTSDQIEVDQFISEPAVSSNLSPLGQRLLFVGARRSAILAGATPGLYTGSFAVTVVY